MSSEEQYLSSQSGTVPVQRQPSTEGLPQLGKARRARWPGLGHVYTASETHRRGRITESVDAVDEDGRRTVKPRVLGCIHGVNELIPEHDVRALPGEQLQSLVGDHPVWATIEVLQGNVHTSKINLAVSYKVKA